MLELDLVIDEVLRIDDPFVSNRRVTTRAVDLVGVRLPAGAPVKLHWTSANRDECVFSDPDAFDPAGHASDNLVYGDRTPCLPRPAAGHPRAAHRGPGAAGRHDEHHARPQPASRAGGGPGRRLGPRASAPELILTRVLGDRSVVRTTRAWSRTEAHGQQDRGALHSRQRVLSRRDCHQFAGGSLPGVAAGRGGISADSNCVASLGLPGQPARGRRPTRSPSAAAPDHARRRRSVPPDRCDCSPPAPAAPRQPPSGSFPPSSRLSPASKSASLPREAHPLRPRCACCTSATTPGCRSTSEATTCQGLYGAPAQRSAWHRRLG